MRFESGMLGFLVVVLAIGFSIAGTILLSAEEQTYTVTKYDLVTDVTGLFDTDESPQYFDYDLSQNYTGYYTMNTVVNGVNYWGGADFTQAKVNNYPIRYAPESNLSKNYTMGDFPMTDPPGSADFSVRVYGFGGDEYGSAGAMGNLVVNMTWDSKATSLSALITAYSLGDYDKVVITPTSASPEDRILFGLTDDFKESQGVATYYWVDYVEYSAKDVYTQSRWGYVTADTIVACLSCEINNVTNQVTYYYGSEATNDTFYKTVKLEDAIIIYGGVNESSVGEPLSNTIHVEAINLPETEYMEISKGVTITGVTP